MKKAKGQVTMQAPIAVTGCNFRVEAPVINDAVLAAVKALAEAAAANARA